MKRIIILAALMLVASGCATNAQTQTNANASSRTTTNTNTAAATKMATPMSEADAIAREKQVWEMLKTKDYDGFAAMLADDQVEVETSGVYDKAGTLAGVKGGEYSSALLSDFKVLKIDDDAVVVTYLVKVGAADANPGGYRQSTVWVNRGGKWLAIFHQGTPVASASPQPK